MNKKFLLTGLLSVPFLVSTALADNIDGLKVVRGESNITISWNPQSSDELKNRSGYAVTWSERQDRMKANVPARIFTNNNSITIRGTDFAKEKYYYFRVFTYQPGDNGKLLFDGSKALQWRWYWNGTYDTNEITINDPVIVSNGSSSTTTTESFSFTPIRTAPYDTFVDLSWSKPYEMPTSLYDGYHLQISRSADFNTILGTLEIDDKKIIRGRIKGLESSKSYYVRGYFVKNDATFGDPTTKSFRTLAPLDRSGRSSASRNLAKIEKKGIRFLDLKKGKTSDTNSNSSNTAQSTSSTQNTSASASSSFNASGKTTAQIRARISEINRLIRQLNTEKKTLEQKLGNTSTTSRTNTQNNTTRNTSNRKMSMAEIREILKKRRQNR